MTTALWIAIVSALTSLIGGGATVAYIKSRTEIRLKEMEQRTAEQDKLRVDVNRLQTRFDDLYSKYLEVLHDHRILQADHQNMRNKMSELRGYKNQAMKIARMTRALSQYHKDGKVDSLVKVFEKELL